MALELKNIPRGSENFYWYERTYVDGKQKSRYLGKRIPPQFENDRLKFEADRIKEIERADLEEKIAQLREAIKKLN
jgi:hypothetical protein